MNELLDILKTIPDPEIPVIDIVELGIVREAKMLGVSTCEVTITPTYSACPAMFTIEEDITKVMKENGWDAKVVTKMFPIWTTRLKIILKNPVTGVRLFPLCDLVLRSTE